MTFVTKQSKYKMCYFITSCNTFHKLAMLTCRCSKNCKYLAKWEMWVLSEFTGAWIFLSIFGEQEEQKNKYIHTFSIIQTCAQLSKLKQKEMSVRNSEASEWQRKTITFSTCIISIVPACIISPTWREMAKTQTHTQVKWVTEKRDKHTLRGNFTNG